MLKIFTSFKKYYFKEQLELLKLATMIAKSVEMLLMKKMATIIL
jgi:hypothetical protein